MQAAAEVGYNINRLENLMPLPNSVEKALEEVKALHPPRGRHLSEYTNYVAGALKELDAKWKSGRSGMTYQELFDGIKELEDDLRRKIDNREFRLTIKDPF